MGLRFSPQARAFVRTLPPPAKRRMRAALDVLAKDPFDKRLDVRQLAVDGGQPVHRMRVGDFRVAYVLDGRTTYITRIFHRRDGYGWLERLG
jgi:mRNA-degrading endonuclease RelE of RelBE toxin-antitoxin system